MLLEYLLANHEVCKETWDCKYSLSGTGGSSGNRVGLGKVFFNYRYHHFMEYICTINLSPMTNSLDTYSFYKMNTVVAICA